VFPAVFKIEKMLAAADLPTEIYNLFLDNKAERVAVNPIERNRKGGGAGTSVKRRQGAPLEII
jgi:hypothetical protein